MKTVSFHGASGGEVTGSNYVVTAQDDNQVLVDFGMFQGSDTLEKRNYEPLQFNPTNLQGVFLTHAHLDHSGRLPLLVFGGFNGKIYMTAPSKSFIEIILSDSARIAEKEHPENPLYTQSEVSKVLSMVEIVPYNKEITVGSFSVVFRDAGHILGSSSIELTDLSNDVHDTIVFSGDLGNTPQSIVKPTQYIEKADYVVMESTYGDSSHPEEDAIQIIQEEINTVEEKGGVLLIPCFALERTQELLHMLYHLKKEGKVKPETLVYLDSPMATDATLVYMGFNEFFNDEIRAHTDNPYEFEGLRVTYEAKDSKQILKDTQPKVIIAGSGMMSGGRILHHVQSYLSDPTTRVLFVGYQANETMGKEILEGAQQVRLKDITIQVRSHIREIKTLSSHADQPRLLTWLKEIKGVKKVFLTHGELPQQQALAEKIKEETSILDVTLPAQNSEYPLA